MNSSIRATKIHALIAAFILAATLSAAFAGVSKRIKFARGRSSATVAGSVVRGDRDKYLIGARAGQKMTVSITSTEDNAVFQIYSPGEQQPLEGAGEGEDAKQWSGPLPDSGDYVIYVGPTRGNATYKLRVAIE